MNVRNTQSAALTITSRIAVLLVFGLLFKSFDLTFVEEAPDYKIRSAAFIIMYVLFGLAIWSGGIKIAILIERKYKNLGNRTRITVLTVSYLIYGIFTALLFGLVYSGTDILLFNRYEAWESFSVFSYELLFWHLPVLFSYSIV